MYKEKRVGLCIRIPEELHKEIEAQAKKESRSITNFILYVIKVYLENSKS